MSKFSFVGAAFLTGALSLCVVVAGCGGGTKTETKKTETKTDNKGTETKTVETKTETGKGGEPLAAKTDGVIKGFVKYKGAPPKMGFIDAINKHNDKDWCLKGSEAETHEQVWIVGKDNGVADVVVFLEAPAGKSFAMNDEIKKNLEPTVAIDQPHCAFVPHIVALAPAAGQKLVIKNSAKVNHNAKITGNPRKNESSSNTITPGGEKTVDINYQKEPLSINCDVHTWMNGKILTFDQPYFAVTKDDGSFEIRNVPTGVELKVKMWSEGNGYQDAETKTFKTGDNPLELSITATK